MSQNGKALQENKKRRRSVDFLRSCVRNGDKFVDVENVSLLHVDSISVIHDDDDELMMTTSYFHRCSQLTDHDTQQRRHC